MCVDVCIYMKNHQRIQSKYSRWKIDENLICFNHIDYQYIDINKQTLWEK